MSAGARRTWVCIPCRETARRLIGCPATCPRCSQLMREMYWRWRAPKKSNDKAWAFLALAAPGAPYTAYLWDRAVVQDRSWPYRMVKGRRVAKGARDPK